jgi:hypothetical protein
MTASLFADLKVIDCASWIAGPAAATILADFGADVIKIEPPGAGDPWRALAPRSDGARLVRRVKTTWAGAVRLRSEAATRPRWSHGSRMTARSTGPVSPSSRRPSCVLRSRLSRLCLCPRWRGLTR